MRLALDLSSNGCLKMSLNTWGVTESCRTKKSRGTCRELCLGRPWLGLGWGWERPGLTMRAVKHIGQSVGFSESCGS